MPYNFSLQANFQIAVKDLLLATKMNNVLVMRMSVMAGFIVRSMDPMLKMRILTSASPTPKMFLLKEQAYRVMKNTVLLAHQSESMPPSVIHI